MVVRRSETMGPAGLEGEEKIISPPSFSPHLMPCSLTCCKGGGLLMPGLPHGCGWIIRTCHERNSFSYSITDLWIHKVLFHNWRCWWEATHALRYSVHPYGIHSASLFPHCCRLIPKLNTFKFLPKMWGYKNFFKSLFFANLLRIKKSHKWKY